MDPSVDGFSIQSTAVTSAEDSARSDGTCSLRRDTTDVSRPPMPGSFVDTIALPFDASATSDAPDDSGAATSDAPDDGGAATPPKDLSRPHSDFPPTPPTMSSSDIAESVPAQRTSSPSPIFADRVRNELERHRSGVSTPINASNSPPTPDPSPPSKSAPPENIDAPRPPLLPTSASSRAESFQTATEGRTPHASTAHVNLLPSDADDTPRQSWIEMGRALGLSNTVLAVQEEERVHNNDADSDIVTRVKNYHLDSDCSDGERDNNSGTTAHSASDHLSTPDSGPVTPGLQRNHSQRHAVVVPRLRRPFQPGDDIKRPDDYLLYGSVGSVRDWKKPERMSTTPPAREMDSEFLRNAEPVFQPKPPGVPESGRDILQRLEAVIMETAPAPLTALPPIPPEERQVITPSEEEVEPVKESVSTSAEPNGIPSPPSTAQKEKSLEDNNMVYRMIQEENAKRHSAISDGSVQARVVAPVENKRKLRHTPKRDSLRGDVSMISSSDSHRLRHKRAIGSLAHYDLTASPGSARDCTNARPSTVGAGDQLAQPGARTGRFDGEKRFSYSAIRDTSPQVAPASALGNPHKLRHSLRHSSLDFTPRSVSDSARPLSMGGVVALAGGAVLSPKLRRSFGDHRLDRNLEVRRTSLGHVGPGSSSHAADFKPPIVAAELWSDSSKHEPEHTTPMLLLSERAAKRDRRESPERSVRTTQSSRRKSLDYRSLHPTVTPMSQISGTAVSEAELCEAQGVTFFPHNNDSLLVVQTARQVEMPDDIPIDEDEPDREGNSTPSNKRTNFQAFVTPADEIGKPLHSVESPLTNPRPAPEPPVIKFIPPTPNDELERQLGIEEEDPPKNEPSRPSMRRSFSLKERFRRFSENFNHPVPFARQIPYRRGMSPRRSAYPQAETRPTHLNPFWQPRDFWEGYSDSEEDDADGDFEPLPPGGDTSDVMADEQNRKSAPGFLILPRAMSKRMPGFRGSGGFHMGNSLGIDRHGSNSRRHYIDPPRSVTSLRLQQQQQSASTPSLRHRQSEEMLKRLSGREHGRKIFKLPFSGGRRLEYIGFGGLGQRLREKRWKRRERQAEVRRAQLRNSIGTRVYHDGPMMSGGRPITR